jgi:hypothetical protein
MQVVLMQVVWVVGLRCRWFGSLVLMQVVRFGGSDGGSARWIVMQVVLMQVVWLVGL